MVARTIKKHQAAIFPILDVLLNGLNFLFHFITAQFIQSESYGILNALLALFTILSVMGTSYQTFLARTLGGNSEINPSAKLPTIFGILPGALLFLLSGAVSLLTKSGLESAMLLATMFLLHFGASKLRGKLQGTGRFFHLNISFYIEVGLKITTIFLFLPLFPSINTALIAICLGYTGAILHGILVLHPRKWLKKAASRLFPSILYNLIPKKIVTTESKEVASIVTIQICMYLFTALDMIIVNYLHPGQSGIFAAVQKYSLVPLFIAASITTVMVPQIAAYVNKPKQFTALWIKYAILIITMTALYIGASFTLLPHTVSTVFNTNYADAANYLGTASLASSLLLVVQFLTITLITRKSKSFLPLLFGAMAVLCLGFIIFGTSLTGMYHTEIAVYLLLSIGLAIVLKKELHNEKYHN